MNTTPANNLRRLRVSQGLTQKQLCNLTGVSSATIRGIETQTRNVSAVLKHRIVNALNKHLGASLKFREVFPNDIDE